jgi:tRNA modification GTPase
LKNADGALWIQDASEEPGGELDEEIPDDIPLIILRNKIDVTGDTPGVTKEDATTLNVSAKSGAGIDDLRSTIRRLAGYKDLGEGAFTARRRHVDAIARAHEHFRRGKEALEKNRAGELFAEDLRLSHETLGEITGALSSDDLLGRIFSEFCIGK